MYEEAAEHVIRHNLFAELDISSNMIDLIRYSWQHERDHHIYSRFDLSGGIDGLPIKLIEFNADTPTMLFETAIVQWMLLKHNHLEDTQQFNNLYQAIVQKVKSLQGEDPARFLFSSVDELPEEEATTQLLQKIAADAGGIASFAYLHNVHFHDEQILDQWDNRYDFWFKLYPWEDISHVHPDLTKLLTSSMQQQKSAVLNPAYTLLYQSKGMLKILYELFPDSPYLLNASFEPLKKEKYVKKRLFGREGANIDIVDENNRLLLSTPGPYDTFKSVYQAYTPFPRDSAGSYYQAGVFYSGEACGLGFRKGSEILDDLSRFVGHIIV
ncbi:MAG: glutathionylspermidine synthase family protein, partial [Campylobacterota bacterium]|nr:glutathionylspermidine synthase family protein [Campylobacterota bacterium]